MGIGLFNMNRDRIEDLLDGVGILVAFGLMLVVLPVAFVVVMVIGDKLEDLTK